MLKIISPLHLNKFTFEGYSKYLLFLPFSIHLLSSHNCIYFPPRSSLSALHPLPPVKLTPHPNPEVECVIQASAHRYIVFRQPQLEMAQVWACDLEQTRYENIHSIYSGKVSSLPFSLTPKKTDRSYCFHFANT